MSESPLVKGRCRHCQAVIAFPAESAGELADCPSCNRAVVLKPSVAAAPPTAKGRNGETIACPKCREPMDEHDTVCVECGFRMPWRIPWIRLGAVGMIGLMALYIVARLDRMDPRVVNELRAALGLSHQQVVASEITSFNTNPEQGANGGGAKKDVPYIPGRLEFERQPGFEVMDGQKYIVGSVRNTSNRDVFYEVAVKFKLEDPAGNNLGEIKDYKDWIEPGETWNFRALVLDPDATKYDFMDPIRGER